MKQKMIVITGTDGSGKSTLIDALVESGIKAEVLSIWDALDESLFATKKDVDNYLCRLSPNARLLFLAHALLQSLEKAEQSSEKTVLFNGYYYKYFASEIALGASSDLVDKLMLLFPVPDLVINLEVDVELAISRKQKLSQYECGAQLPSKSSFIAFQKLATENWIRFNQSSWGIVNGNLSKVEVLENSLKLINSRNS